MTNKEQLREEFERKFYHDYGGSYVVPEPDKDELFDWFWSEIEKMDKDYRHRIIHLLDKAIERDGQIKELEIANKMYEEDLKIKEAESGRETAP